MPKVASPHFDPHGLLCAVHQQDVGLKVSTNDPDGFKRILYNTMRADPSLRCHIYSDPRSRRQFLLLKTRLEHHIEEDPDASPIS